MTRSHAFLLVLAVALLLVCVPAYRLCAQSQLASTSYTYATCVYDAGAGAVTLNVTNAGDQQTKTAKRPGGSYQSFAFPLEKGVHYTVQYLLNGVIFYTDPVYHELQDPTHTHVQKLYKEGRWRSESAPVGKVMLVGKTADMTFDRSRAPDIRISSANGGQYSRSASNQPPGTFHWFVAPGNSYTVTYNIGDRIYEHTGTVVDNGQIADWVLEFKGMRQPPGCSYRYGPWGRCVAGHMTRSVIGEGPAGCDESIVPPVTDSICKQAVPARDTSLCTSFTYSAWSACAGGAQTRGFSALPPGCTSQPPPDSLSRPCSQPPAPNPAPSGFTPSGFDNPPHRDKNVCEDWHVMVLGDVPKEWTIGDPGKQISLKIETSGFSGGVATRTIHDATGGLKELIAVNDSVWLELKSTDSSFAITADTRNHHRSVLDGDPVKFSWTVRAINQPVADSTSLTLVPWTLSCNTGRLVEGEDRPYTVKVHVTGMSVFENMLKWCEDHFARIAGLLATLAGIFAYFKGWFKRKDKSETAAATGGVSDK